MYKSCCLLLLKGTPYGFTAKKIEAFINNTGRGYKTKQNHTCFPAVALARGLGLAHGLALVLLVALDILRLVKCLRKNKSKILKP